jgi:hypothetical protein
MDIMARNTDTDLLPWIVGGVLVATAAVATVIAATLPTAPAPPNVSTSSTASKHLAVAAQTDAAVAPTQPSVAVESTKRSALPPGQVWECVVNGQKIFSDSRCGESASIRQLGELNRMDATPVLPAAVYRPPDAGYALPPPEPYAPEFANDPYVSEQVIVINERTRREHMSRWHHHHHGPAPKH